jgi:hypothetical protein
MCIYLLLVLFKIRKHRVRLYAVNDECWWDYKGTGHVICIFDTEPVQAFYLIVRSEDDSKWKTI